MTVMDAAARYDSYWSEREPSRTRARSRSRAALALGLLGVRMPLASRSRAAADSSPHATMQSLLEVGCGPGWALEVFRDAGFRARGVDVSPAAAALASERGLVVDLVDIERAALDPRALGAAPGFDVVVALEVLEHLVDPVAALAALRGALAPGGALVVSLPNEFHLLRRLAVLCGRPGFGGHDDPHLRYFDDARARRLFAAAEMRVVARRSDSLVPPRRAWLRRLTAPFHALSPGLLSIAHVYLLETNRERVER